MKFVYTAAWISDIRILDIKVADVLMMDLVAVAATQTSGYCRSIEKLTSEDPDRTAKERGDDLVRLANARALFPPLAPNVCSSWSASLDMIAQLCATGVGL